VDREIVLGGLIPFICGPILTLVGSFPVSPSVARSGRQLEQEAWRRLWLPLLTPALVFVGLLGWAFQEPENSDERLLPFVFVVATPFAVVAIRAALRALQSLVARRAPLAGTVGLLRPRASFARTFIDALDPEALSAAREHEAAHVRHRDPFRIWLAQLATDFQWPSLTARLRLQAWLRALELARDDEARLRGVDGADLAAAIVTAARLQRPSTAGACLTGDGEGLKHRVARLLEPLPPDDPASLPGVPVVVLAIALTAAFSLGVCYGEKVVRSLPGVDISILS
jgi:hypothetical protein